MRVTLKTEIALAPLSAAETVNNALAAITRRGVTVKTYSVGTEFIDDWAWDKPSTWLGVVGVPHAMEQPMTITVEVTPAAGESTSQAEARARKAIEEGIAEVTDWDRASAEWSKEIDAEVIQPTIDDVGDAAKVAIPGILVLALLAGAIYLYAMGSAAGRGTA